MSGDLGLRPYLDLLGSFLSHKMTAAEFERRYLHLFKADDEIRPDAVFEILDALFSDVDAYSAEFGESDEHLTEPQLRDRAAKAYRSLQSYAEGP